MAKTFLDQVIEMLDARKGEWRQISSDTDIPYSTLCKIAQGWHENPSVRTIQKLHDYLRKPADKARAA